MREGWTFPLLREITEECRGSAALQGDQNYELWSVPSFSAGHPEIVKGSSILSAKRPVEAGDVLLCKINPRINRVWVVGANKALPKVASTEWIVLRPKSTNVVSPRWLQLYLSSSTFRRWIVGEISGATGSHTRAKPREVMCQRVPLPPLSEQKRIVAILDEAFAGIATAVSNTEKNLANAWELFEAYSNVVFSQRKERWRHTKLGGEIGLQTGFAFKSKGYTTDIDGVRLLRGDNIVPGGIRWRDHKKWPRDEIEAYRRYELEHGDIVLAMDRTWIKGGLKYAQIKGADLPCLLVQRVARLRAGPRLNSHFLRFLIGSRGFTEYILSIQTGLGVPHVSGPQISEFEFFMPPVDEQAEIAGTLEDLSSSVGRLESNYKGKVSALSELKQSLLQRAFCGELTATAQHDIEMALA